MSIGLPSIGTETEKGVISALNDLFGPSFRETGEYLADKVRLHRAKALVKILRRAKELENELPASITPPSLKFLLPFSEKSSLEDSDELSELWSRLLVDASRSESAHHIFCIDALSKLSAESASLFEEICLNPVVKRGALRQMVDTSMDMTRERLILDCKKIGEQHKPEDYFLALIGLSERFGARFLEAAWWLRNGKMEFMHDAVAWRLSEKQIVGLGLLQQLGLIRHDLYQDLKIGKHELSTEIAYVTPLGAEFFFSTHPPSWREDSEGREAGDYPDAEFIPLTEGASLRAVRDGLARRA